VDKGYVTGYHPQRSSKSSDAQKDI